ncbi:MAG: hypothetical protein AAF415_07645, partial [Pseudomonadota bacterium]
MTVGTTTTIEAEDMTASGGYQEKSFDGASGGGYVQTWSEGTLTSTFNGDAGTYSLDLTVFDENDGQSTVEVWVNGQLVQSLVLDHDAGGNYIYGTSSVMSVDGIQLEPGDTIELRGFADGGEPARIDKLDLTMTGEAGGATQVLMLEQFESGWDLTASENVVSSDFVGDQGTAASNATYDGNLLFREVDMSGLQSGLIMLDLETDAHCAYFEDSSSAYYDYLRVEVSYDGGEFIVLDDFEVDYASQIFYGEQTGQSFGPNGSTLSYAVPEGTSSVQLRIVSHLSANNEVFRVDDVKITAQEPADPVEVPTIDAVDDTITLGETQDITADGTATEVEDAPKSLNILANDDTSDGDASIVSVVAADSDLADGGQPTEAPGANVGSAFEVTTEGGRTGTVTVQADGTLLFDGGDNFVDLTDDQTDQFQLDYTIQLPVEDMPSHNLLFVLDISNSTVNGTGSAQDVFDGENVADMNGDGLDNTVLDAEIAAVMAAIDNLLAQGVDPAKIDVGIVTFSGVADGFATIDAETLGTWALSDGGIAAALADIQSGGWTNYEAGLQEAEDWFAGQSGDGAINKLYFLSDGRPTIDFQNGEYVNQDITDYGDEVARIATDNNAEIHAIGLGANSDLDYLNDLDNTDGAVQVLDASSLTATLTEATNTLLQDTATVTVVINGEGIAIPTIDAVDDTITLGEVQDITADGTATEVGEAPKSLNILANDDLSDGTLGVDTAITGVGPADTDPADGGAPTEAPAANVGASFEVTTEGGRTGTVTVQADGTLLFDGGDSFEELFDGENDSFQLEYTVTRTFAGADDVRVIDFDTASNGDALASGDIVELQYDGVSIRAERSGNPGEANRAMVFDTENVTGGDTDLASSNLGNVLIISEDLDSSDADDNAGGGTFVFTFDEPSDVDTVTFLDTEEPTPVIQLFDADGNQIGSDIAGPVTTDGGQGIAAINVDNVSTMKIILQGSGAVDNIGFSVPTEESVSDTAVVTVVIEGEGVFIPPDADEPPVAVDDLIVTTQDEDVSGVNIITAENTGGATATLGEDSDPDAPTSELRVTFVGGEVVAPGATVSFDVDNGLGQSGTVTVDDLGNLTFSNAQGFDTAADDSAEFTFDYVIVDADGLPASAQVTIQVTDNPEPPTATDDVIRTDDQTEVNGVNIITTADTSGLTNTLGEDTDLDAPQSELAVTEANGQALAGGSISFQVSNGLGQSATVTVNSDGSTSVTDLTGFDTAADDSAEFTFDYVITDADGLTDTATVTIEVADTPEPLPPTANDDVINTDDQTEVAGVNIISGVDTSGLANVLGADSDADAPVSELSVTAVNGNALVAGSTSFQVANGTGQSATITVNADGSTTVTDLAGFDSAADDSASFSFNYEITDADGLSDTATVTVNVTDTPDARNVSVSGSVQSTATVASQAIAILIDMSAGTDLINGSGFDLNNDGSVTAMDTFIAGIVDLAESLVADGRGDQELTLIPTTGVGTGAPIVTTAAEFASTDFSAAAADPGSVLNSLPLVQAVFDLQADALDPSIDFEQGLLAAKDVLTDANGDTVASSNEVIVLTATDGRTLEFADIDADGNFVAPEGQVTGEQIPVSDPDLFEDDLLTSDPTAAAAELDALGVDIDVVFIDPDDFLLTSLLDLVEGPNGDGAIEPSGPMGLDTLIETPTSGDVDAVEAFTVAINGDAVDGLDA